MKYSVFQFFIDIINQISDMIFCNIFCAATLYLSMFVCPSVFMSFAFMKVFILAYCSGNWHVEPEFFTELCDVNLKLDTQQGGGAVYSAGAPTANHSKRNTGKYNTSK